MKNYNTCYNYILLYFLITIQLYKTTGTGPQGARDNDYSVAMNIKTFVNEDCILKSVPHWMSGQKHRPMMQKMIGTPDRRTTTTAAAAAIHPLQSPHHSSDCTYAVISRLVHDIICQKCCRTVDKFSLTFYVPNIKCETE